MKPAIHVDHFPRAEWQQILRDGGNGFADGNLAGNGDGRERGGPRQAAPRAPWAGTPRNATCPCGSGKKFKHCHGRI